MKFLKLIAITLLLSSSLESLAQSNKNASSKFTKANHPESFTINKSDFDELFTKKANTNLDLSSNKYLDKSTIEMNTLNGDIKFLRIKLNYFSNAYLLVQVNGSYSTQVFVMSKDKSIFYKGKIEKDLVVMTKCAEDEIVSE